MGRGQPLQFFARHGKGPPQGGRRLRSGVLPPRTPGQDGARLRRRRKRRRALPCKNASLYGLDTRAFALFGHSAGGHLALLTALSAPSDFQGDPELAGFDPTFACAAAKAPVTTFFHADHFRLDMRRDRSALERLLGAPPSANQAEARALSPISYISKDSPATLLLHGDADNLVTWKDSALFHTHAKKAGAKCELEIAKGGDHLFLAKDGRPALRGMQRRIDEFLITRLTAAV